MIQSENADWISVLRKAADAGRKAILNNYSYSDRRKVVKIGAGGDFTLKIDETSEKAIQRSLRLDLGKDSFIFVSEEIGEVTAIDESPKPIVICDPLDGSHNAQVGIPLFSISLSVLGVRRIIRAKEPRRFEDVDFSLVRSVTTEDEFFAVKGGGAFHNMSRLRPRTSLPDRIETLLIECGDVDFLKGILSNFSANQIHKTRILGSAALSFSYLADGTADAFIFAQPNGARTIDSPAGYLIAKEAGCVFSDLADKVRDVGKVEVSFQSKISLLGASNQKVLRRLKRLVRIG